MRLSKTNRLAKPGEYRRVYQSEYWGNTRLFSFNVLPLVNDPQLPDYSRLGVTVSKKVAKSAVARNRIKRQIKEFYRHRQGELLPVELVITAKPACLQASDEERQSALLELWTKLLKWQRWYKRNNRGTNDAPDAQHSGS